MTGISLDSLAGIEVAVSVVLGHATLTIGDALKLAPGSVVALDARSDALVELLVNGVPLAWGDIVETDEGTLAVEIRETRSQRHE